MIPKYLYTETKFNTASNQGINSLVQFTNIIKVLVPESFSQHAVTCSKLTIKTLEQDLRYVQS